MMVNKNTAVLRKTTWVPKAKVLIFKSKPFYYYYSFYPNLKKNLEQNDDQKPI